MKKFIEKIKNIRSGMKIILFVSDCLKTVVEVYEKHFPEENKPIETIETKEG